MAMRTNLDRGSLDAMVVRVGFTLEHVCQANEESTCRTKQASEQGQERIARCTLISKCHFQGTCNSSVSFPIDKLLPSQRSCSTSRPFLCYPTCTRRDFLSLDEVKTVGTNALMIYSCSWMLHVAVVFA